MPYHDGTGPSGNGRPGRGLGPCGRFGTAGNTSNSLVNDIIGIIYEIIRSLLTKKSDTNRR